MRVARQQAAAAAGAADAAEQWEEVASLDPADINDEQMSQWQSLPLYRFLCP